MKFLKNIKKIGLAVLAMSLFILILFFQNCSPQNFSQVPDTKIIDCTTEEQAAGLCLVCPSNATPINGGRDCACNIANQVYDPSTNTCACPTQLPHLYNNTCNRCPLENPHFYNNICNRCPQGQTLNPVTNVCEGQCIPQANQITVGTQCVTCPANSRPVNNQCLCSLGDVVINPSSGNSCPVCPANSIPVQGANGPTSCTCSVGGQIYNPILQFPPVPPQNTCACPADRPHLYNNTCNQCSEGQFFVNGVCTGAHACFQASATTDGTAAKPWKINSCECLQKIETDPGFSQKYHNFQLASNLDCSSIANFTPIQSFSGILNGQMNGQNYMISNFKSSGSNSAMFRNNNGIIENLKFSNANVDGNSDSVGWAGIVCVGDRCGGTYRNIDISNSSITGKHHVGSVASITRTATLQNITVSNTSVRCTHYNNTPGAGYSPCIAGGIVGGLYVGPPGWGGSSISNSSFSGTLRGASLGGIAGASLGQMNAVTASATFTSTNDSPTAADPITRWGGLVGIQVGGNAGDPPGKITNSNATIIANLNVQLSDINTSYSRVSIGGLVGENLEGSGTPNVIRGTLDNSQATVDIRFTTNSNPASTLNWSSEFIGGIVGYTQSNVTNCRASGIIQTQKADYVSSTIGKVEQLQGTTVILQNNTSTVQLSTLP